MGRLNYSITPAGRSSRAMGMELHISPKHAREICRTLRGMRANAARAFLEDVIALKRPVPFKRYRRNVAHRHNLVGWDAGRYPEKAARAVLAVLDNALANAEYKGMEAERMRILHAGTKKGRTIQGWMPRAMGRATPKNTETVSVEMVLTEVKS
ncbi:MAG TPA: 50S ribosomal protein L22 [Methanothrix sp.]|nr:50S ribosomal protein L22 [Methanothrix sp.]HPC89828.1 50S ribosomal protein L22 [Methanothrix sp.]HRS85328.1 50S ribosomal protein L22 [Methanothrix sp.]HRT17307.1 50S ribosomal protein L22 [Methanothrix sp.]